MYVITAAYSGDTVYAASTSAAMTVMVTAPPPADFFYFVAVGYRSGKRNHGGEDDLDGDATAGSLSHSAIYTLTTK